MSRRVSARRRLRRRLLRRVRLDPAGAARRASGSCISARTFLSAAHTSDVIRPSLGAQNTLGYDGQYYFAFAADPAHAHDYMDGNAGIVYSRPFYPVVSRAASGGSVRHCRTRMLVVNLLAVLAGARPRSRSGSSNAASRPGRRCSTGSIPGLVVTVFRDLTEPVAFGSRGLRRARLRRARPVGWPVGGLFALAVLTRETIVPFALAGAAALALDDRHASGAWHRWRRAAAFAAATCGPLVVWRLVVRIWIGQPTQEVGHERGWVLPLHGIWSWWPFDHRPLADRPHRHASGACRGNGRRPSPPLRAVHGPERAPARERPPLRRLAAPGGVHRLVGREPGGGRRRPRGAVLPAGVVARAARPRRSSLAGAFALSIAWYLLAAALFGHGGIHEITT